MKTTIDNVKPIALTASLIKLDSKGDLPSRIPLFTTFDLPKSNRGHFTVDVEDLKQMKEHFDAKQGFPTDDGSTGLPIDFEHRRRTEEAAAWFTGLDLVVDEDDPKKATLFADPVEWTDVGGEAIRSGRYKMVSPTGAFGKRNGKLSVYAHHTNSDNKLPNLLMGAGLVNEPFQSMMAPIRMGAMDGDNNNVIYVYNVEEEKQMNLDTLRVKDINDLNGAEYKFLADHKTELSAEDQAKFALEVADQKDELSAEDKELLEAIKDGNKKVVDANETTVEKERLDKLEKTAEDYRKEKADSVIDLHVKRGAIRQDASEYWTGQLLGADSDTQRKGLEDALAALPANEALNKEIGDGGTADVAAAEALTNEINTLMASNDKLTYKDALSQVQTSNPALYKQYQDEQNGGK